MSIQSNINQQVSLASLLLTQSPSAKFRKEGLSLQSKGMAAQRGLENIHESYKELKEGKREPYSETEVADIEARIPQLNKDIYNTIIAAEDPNLKKYINKEALGKRADRSAMLNELSNFRSTNESKIAQIQKATQSAQENLTAKRMEYAPSREFTNRIMEGVYSPLTDPRTEARNGK